MTTVMPLPNKSGQAIRLLLQEFDPANTWEECVEAADVSKGTRVEYATLARDLTALYPEEDRSRLSALCSSHNGLPKRFVNAIDPTARSPPKAPKASEGSTLLDEIAGITARLEQLEGLVRPLSNEKEERAATLDQAGKLLKATNHRLDELPTPAPAMTPQTAPPPTTPKSMASLLRRGRPTPPA